MGKNRIHLVIVTGLSGSGKSTAIKAFEDIGYFCIDNLPAPLLPHFLALCEEDRPELTRVALGIDIRGRSFLPDTERFFETLEESGYRPEVLFFEAATEVLQRRYSQTRRLHPMADQAQRLVAAIERERRELQGLRARATRIVDTSDFSVHQLKALITRTYSLVSERERLSVQILSFGFKYGLPFEADLVMDVRFLPNPYFVEELRSLDGCSAPVRDWVLARPQAVEFVDDYTRLLEKLLPQYIREGKRYLTLAVGCTGGKHRSVVIAERMADKLRSAGYHTVLSHRDIYLD
ncbi:UPF0042 nucleotide-binding protein [Desulfacinum hydrothermale DSM 13146]|uniref:UPF0042 nucleotide-binding protein n=1 Tax=Desulfacinum hydrothermale DSM 13146 TaxID=1121390 RepID=A0A1W1XS04_9BACT|nr:RNase adapter RapZ [Desulfacinum hydrothermale]SMC26635.1 UPF0042 nucleotide-binding protein [Desulfacinum hydrothermale DSM 13146]